MEQYLNDLKDALSTEFKRQFKTIDFYGGEFDEEEVKRKSYSCPALFITVMGWADDESNKRMIRQGGRAAPRGVRIGMFIVTKSEKGRVARMLQSVNLTAAVEDYMKAYNPDCAGYCAVEARRFVAENLYNEKIDKLGQAVFVLSFTQTLSTCKTLSKDLPDLLGVDVVTHTHTHIEPTPTTGDDLPVTIEITGDHHG